MLAGGGGLEVGWWGSDLGKIQKIKRGNAETRNSNGRPDHQAKSTRNGDGGGDKKWNSSSISAVDKGLAHHDRIFLQFGHLQTGTFLWVKIKHS